MKIRMRSIVAGPGFCADAGQVIDIEEAQAKAFIAGGHAEAVDEPRSKSATPPAAAPIAAGKKAVAQAKQPIRGKASEEPAPRGATTAQEPTK